MILIVLSQSFTTMNMQVVLLSIIGVLGTALTAVLSAIVAGIFSLLRGQQAARLARKNDSDAVRAALVDSARHVAEKVEQTDVRTNAEFIELKGICNGRLSEALDIIAATDPIAIEAAKKIIANRDANNGKI